MLDVSIKELKKALNTQAKKLEFLKKHIRITEKFDGTKLTLIRNNVDFDSNDYAKNWIVSYKGNVLFPSEVSGISSERLRDDVSKNSIGTSQYGLVHEHLKHWHSALVPKNTELFIEFIQNKPTLSRDYDEMHGLYLLGYAPVEYTVYGQRVFTTASQMNYTDIERYAKALNLKTPPEVFEGLAGELGSFDDIIERYENLWSNLGGKAEGVVIHTDDNQLYKIVRTDQYDKAYRAERKARWSLDGEEEAKYWIAMNAQSKEMLTLCNQAKSLDSFFAELSRQVYSLSDGKIQAKNNKKNLIQRQDDLFLTSKLRHDRCKLIKNSNEKIGVFVMSGKPVHRGHWMMIEKIAKENDCAFLYVSVNSRGEDDFKLSGGDVLKVWNKYLLSKIPSNVQIRFCDNPYFTAIQEIRAFESEENKHTFQFYAGKDDAELRWGSDKLQKSFPTLSKLNQTKVVSINREHTDMISGTKMREYLALGGEKQKLQFLMHLPSCLTLQEREQTWRILRGK